MPVILDPQSPALHSFIRPGDRVMWGQANAEPLPLTQALMAQRQRIGRFDVLLGIANNSTCTPQHADCVTFSAYCGAGANRDLANAGLLDILPCHYSEMAERLADGRLRIDVLMLQLAPADRHGRYSLSLACEYLLPALARARVVIAEVNQQAPRTHGEGWVTDNDLHAVLLTDRPLPSNAPSRVRPADQRIAEHIASLIPDGATLQMGIGAIPDAVLGALGNHRDLGVHSGSLGDGVARLMQSGVINNQRKAIDRGVSVGGILMGSQLLHDFAHDNPAIELRTTQYTHNAEVLASIDQLVAINSAVEVDLTGQVNSEVAAGSYVGAVGGALDFIRGAQRSRDGLPIIALPATAGAHSRIVTRLNGPATIPRSDAGLVVTEFGVADLRGLNLRQRFRALLQVADPQHRERLEAEWAAQAGT